MPILKIREKSFGEFTSIILEDDTVRISVLPELGSKVNSLRSKLTGREFLYAPETPAGYYRSRYGDPFLEKEATGFDEAFPTVMNAFYPDGVWKGTELPEQGELWSAPWSYQVESDAVRLNAGGVRLPYAMEKRITLPGNGSVNFSYELTNYSSHEMKYIWAGHVLLRISSGSVIKLPSEVSQLRLFWSHEERLGKLGAMHSWPEATDARGRKVNLAVFGDRSLNYADKLFTPKLASGFCGLYHPESHESILFEFPVSAVPYVGIWINQGGWPHPGGEYHLGLEPSNANSDRLDLATLGSPDEYGTIGPKSKLRWSMTLRIARGEAAMPA